MTYETRKFGGKIYHFSALRETKPEADEAAKKYRKRDYLARVVKMNGVKEVRGTPIRKSTVWGVYLRKKE